ncbi:putative hydro-lyase [Demetria terragena]|uniref:putative hydro-lyase n=1 Tax=Demetria terragena TaxID=63959 RepID=UPI00047630A2|nr:putative hydro-lyase [Demetria terragena]
MGSTDVASAVWQRCRTGEFTGPTTGLAPGYVQANLAILPRADAFDFLRFCQRNPKPCPIVEVTDVGDPVPHLTSPGADLRTDLPRYRVYRGGELVAEPTDLLDVWRDDLVSFLIGCSFTFEHGLLEAGVPVRHLEAGRNVPMYRTNQRCIPAGRFDGPLVVSMRSIPADLVSRAVTVSATRPDVHGAPISIGSPEALGIADVNHPEWGDPPVVEPGDIPVFWACGVTPQAVALEARPELMITHAPGHMFVTGIATTPSSVEPH